MVRKTESKQAISEFQFSFKKFVRVDLLAQSKNYLKLFCEKFCKIMFTGSTIDVNTKLEVTFPARIQKKAKFYDSDTAFPADFIGGRYRMITKAILTISRDELRRLDGDWLHVKYTASAVANNLNRYCTRIVDVELSAASGPDVKWFFTPRDDGSKMDGVAILTYDQYKDFLSEEFGLEIFVVTIVDVTIS